MTTDISSDADENSSLALELTEMGLSLFVCDGDVPLECIAHVALDDPDFSKKLSSFRAAAETSVGKGFETHIWLPDDQVMFRSLKLDEEDANDAREAATSALSASTPFQGNALCFDLGDTNGAGYTPVAAIPKEKMDEAMAFAKKMRMNPRLITTSNVVAGFSSRPQFKEFTPAPVSRQAPLRVAALAMLLAAPIFLLSAEIERIPGSGSDGVNAFVATVETIEAETSAPAGFQIMPVDQPAFDSVVPAELGAIDFDVQMPKLAAVARPETLGVSETGADILSLQVSYKLGESAQEGDLLAIELPSALSSVDMVAPTALTEPHNKPAQISEVFAQTTVFEPAYVTLAEAALSLSAETGFHKLDTANPIAVFEPGPDDAPSVAMLSVEYVQNVFDGNIEIHDLMAVDEVSANAFSTPEKNPSLVRVANLGEGVLVQRPQSRAAPKLVQPAFMPRPEKRPLPLLPEQAFDYNSMVPIDPAIAIEDPPPTGVSSSVDTPPRVKSPPGLVLRFDEATVQVLAEILVRKREKAVQDAQSRRADALANLISPRARDAAPLAGSNGALAQFRVASLGTSEQADMRIPASFGASDPSVLKNVPLRVSRPFAQPSLPSGLTSGPRNTAIVRELVPYDPESAAAGESIRFIETASRPTLPRPPSRRNSAAVQMLLTDPAAALGEDASLEVIEANSDPAGTNTDLTSPAEMLSDTDQVVEVPEQIADLSPVEASANGQATEAELAAAALPDFSLPRPPVRPERSTDVAELIEQLEPAPQADGPISKYAISELYAPIKRPASLQAQAKRILEQRNSVTHQVAIKQEPVPATPKERLRIPTGARVGTAATIKDGIALGDISLIGIYGTSKTRRALVRLPQGRYVQISRGDRVSGWTVSAVSEDAVRIQKGSKNKVLRLPN